MSDRIFQYNDQAWDDPGEEFSNEDVRQHLTQFFPELANATVEESERDDGTTVVKFVKRAGTKGRFLCTSCRQIMCSDCKDIADEYEELLDNYKAANFRLSERVKELERRLAIGQEARNDGTLGS